MLNQLDITKATGLDGISARFLRNVSSEIAQYITHIINLSLQQDKVPRNFKQAKKTPIYYKKRIRLIPVTTDRFQY